MNQVKQETIETTEKEPPARRPSAVALGEFRGKGGTESPDGQESVKGSVRLIHHVRTASAFPISARPEAFRNTWFPHVADGEWNDWRWQVRNSIGRLDELETMVRLSDDERTALASGMEGLPFRITPYYASLLDVNNSHDPLRRTVVPVTAESSRLPGEQEDPLTEESHTPVPGVVHRYPDRVLFLVSDFCATYCRYCTRSRRVGRRSETARRTREQWEAGIDYIASNRHIRDVVISGGDPLLLSDDRLSWLLGRLRAIPHLEILRIGSKAPVVLPQRITPALVRMLRRYHPLWMNIHFTHPDELTDEVKQACGRLADGGIPLQSQTVLLAGVNDSTAALMSLFHGLLRMRVRPYYLFQCDPIVGSGHFRTPLSRGIAIMQELRGYTTGFAVPLYVIDTPGGGGKIPVMPECVMGHEGDTVLLKNFEGQVYRYRDNAALSHALVTG